MVSVNDHDQTGDTPVDELADFIDPADGELTGRVQRSINRRLLVADSLDLGLGGMLAAAWHYLLSVLEAINPDSSHTEDRK